MSRARGRPARLSRELIVDAALQSNLDTLTVRELAGRLGVAHGSLYRWVPGRDALLDLVSEALVDRIVSAAAESPESGLRWLRRLAWAMHDEILAVPGYATRMARPHRHHAPSFARLHDVVVAAFLDEGVGAEEAEHSWYVFATTVVGWLAATETSAEVSDLEPRFDLFLDVLLRGLPVREPPTARPGAPD